MTTDDLRRIFFGPTLFRLDTILSPRLIPVLYVTGLATHPALGGDASVR